MTKAPRGGLRQEKMDLGEDFLSLRQDRSTGSTVLTWVTRACLGLCFLIVWLSGVLD